MNEKFFLLMIGCIILIYFANKHKNDSIKLKKTVQPPKSIKVFKEKIEKHKKITNKIKKKDYEKVI